MSIHPQPLSIASLVLALSLGWLLPQPCAQDVTQDPAQRSLPTLVDADQLTTTFYTPKHVSRRELGNLAMQLHGRRIYVTERGGFDSAPVSNIQELGDSLLIYDDAANSQRVLAWLKLVDRAPQAQDPSASKPSLETRRWSPRHISLSAGLQSLSSFQHTVPVVYESGRIQDQPNITMVPERNLIVLRDSPTQLDLMLEQLTAIDQPETQLMITAMVIVGERLPTESSMPAPPAELTTDLARLVPYEHFRLSSMGMVRSSARAPTIEMRMDNGDNLQLRPDAYDEAAGDLSSRCEFKSGRAFQFETRTTLRLGEWTVLGVSGGEALFVVVRIEALDG